MDRINHYRQIIERVFADYLEFIPREETITTITISDPKTNHYLLLDIGWLPTRRIHSVIMHLHIQDDKIWIEQDRTEDGVAHELLRAGVPPQDIVLGFQPPDMRPFAQELLKTA